MHLLTTVGDKLTFPHVWSWQELLCYVYATYFRLDPEYLDQEEQRFECSVGKC